MSARGYALHSVCPQLYFPFQLMVTGESVPCIVWGAYSPEKSLFANECVQKCAADAKCKAIVYVPGQEPLVTMSFAVI